MARPTVKQKRDQLRRRGWSDLRIDQYLKDWKWPIGRTFNPKSTTRKNHATEN